MVVRIYPGARECIFISCCESHATLGLGGMVDKRSPGGAGENRATKDLLNPLTCHELDPETRNPELANVTGNQNAQINSVIEPHRVVLFDMAHAIC